MQHQGPIDDLGFCPSFNCYSSDNPASSAAAKVSSQLQQEARFHDHDFDDEDFEFSSVLGREEISAEDMASEGRTAFPLFNRDLLIQDEVDREAVQGKFDEQVNAGSASLGKLFINEQVESASASSSSEADESEGEGEPPGVFCVWRPKMDVGSSSPLSKCKKSSSTGSGSKRWRIRDLLRRSNSEGKEPLVLLTHKKEIPKQKGNSGEVSMVPVKSKPSVHELFYVQQRAKHEDGKRKSYLPYRQGLVGFFTNVNGSKGKKFPF